MDLKAVAVKMDALLARMRGRYVTEPTEEEIDAAVKRVRDKRRFGK